MRLFLALGSFLTLAHCNVGEASEATAATLPPIQQGLRRSAVVHDHSSDGPAPHTSIDIRDASTSEYVATTETSSG